MIVGTTPPGIPHREFLERALTAAGEWTRYSDPKALGVLVLLGLGISDLIDQGGRFVHPHQAATATCRVLRAEGHSCAGIAATAAFIVACGAAVIVVGLVTHALFSRLTLRGLLGLEKEGSLPKSVFFFGEIRRFGSAEAYTQAVLAKNEQELLRDMAGQVYEVSSICQIKHFATQRAYCHRGVPGGLGRRADLALDGRLTMDSNHRPNEARRHRRRSQSPGLLWKI